eukprot:1709304-Alexandrium_andersonii.AAC.1
MQDDQVVADVAEFAETLSKELGKGLAMIVKLRACGAGNDIAEHINKNVKIMEASYEKIKGSMTKEIKDPKVYTPIMQGALPSYRQIKKYVRAGQAV